MFLKCKYRQQFNWAISVMYSKAVVSWGGQKGTKHTGDGACHVSAGAIWDQKDEGDDAATVLETP